MADRFDSARRLEPRFPFRDLNDGVSAPLADPLWLMGRQWQLGELQGENAASPVLVRVEATSEPLLAPSDRPNSNLRTTPAEAIIEGEPEDWWTIGRRIRIGRELGPLVSGVNPHLMPQQLPPPTTSSMVLATTARPSFDTAATSGSPKSRGVPRRHPGSPHTSHDLLGE
jgi:hypothetical protein